MHRFVLVPIVALSMAVPVAAGAGTAPPDGSLFRPAVTGTRGVVATEDARATATALRVLNKGGNAFDAAVAAVFTIGVTKPEACGIGGGGFLLARRANGKVLALDFREKAPASPTYTPRWRMDLGGLGAVAAEETGRGVVGVPGTVDGMAQALRVLGSGRIRWADVLADASRHARAGFVAHGATVSEVYNRQGSLNLFPESRRLLVLPTLTANATSPQGGAEPAEPTLVFPEYADTLDRLASHGARDFYEGETARRLATEMAHTSGFEAAGDVSEMTLRDLQRYRATWRAPVSTRYRGTSVYGVPAPTSGPTAIIETLNILEGYDLAASGRGSADVLHLVAEAKKLAWADRNAYLGDPEAVRVPTKTLTSKRFAAQRRALINPHRAGTPTYGKTEVRPGTPSRGPEGGNTTSLSVLDAAGNAIAVTCTLETGYGSAYIPAGLGFVLNGQLHDFDEVPAGTAANAPAPGKRPRSSTSPMIVVKGSVPLLVTGGQGGATIPGGVLWSILNTVDHGLDGARSLDAPRVDAFTGTDLYVEEKRFAPAVLDVLRARGHVLTVQGEYGPSPVVSAVGIRNRVRWAAGDPRGDRWPAAQR